MTEVDVRAEPLTLSQLDMIVFLREMKRGDFRRLNDKREDLL